MEFQINTNQVILAQINQVESGEYNVTECRFNFSSEYDGLTKIAVFTGANGDAYKITILNNKCEIPSELLTESQIVRIGVYAYDVQGTEFILRYSPMPTRFMIEKGSYVVNAVNMSRPTPTEVEQLQSQITHNANNIEGIQGDIAGINQELVGINGELLGINRDIDDIKAEQTEQNTKIQKNTDDIGEINQGINVINEDIDNLEQDLTNYSLITETGSQINLNVNSTNYQITAILKDKNGNVIYTSNAIDLPIESMIVNARYDNTTKEIVLTLQNGNTLRISVADLVSGLVSETQLQSILANYYNKIEVDNLLSNLAERVSTNKEDIADIKEEQTTQNTNIEELQSQVETLQTDLESANAEIEELNTDISNMAKAMYKVDGQGSDITLPNTSENKFVEFGLEGRTEQEQLSGKNLFDGNFVKKYIDQATGQPTSYEMPSYRATENYIELKANIEYIASRQDTAKGLILYYYEKNGDFISASADSQANTKTTILYDRDVLLKVVLMNCENDKDYTLQLEQGSTATSYEEYCGGIPSPNPQFPQPIKNVTGNANVKIQNKNLAWNGWAEDFVSRINNNNLARIEQYDNRNCLRAFSGVGWEDYDNKYIYKMDFKQNTQYTFVFNMLTTTTALTNFNIEIHYTDGTGTGVAKVPNNNWNKVIITSAVGKTIKYITPWYTNGDRYIDLDTFMVLEGAYTAETIPKYVEHQEQNLPFTFSEGQRAMQGTELLDDGIHNIRVHVIVNGTENWQVYSNKEHCFKLQLKYTSASGLCTHYQNIGATYFDIKNGIYLTFTNVIIISDLRFSSVEDFKSWLVQQYNNGTPLEVEYVIRGNEEKIPYNSTQQVQYNNIKANASSYDDITIISSESDELGFDMKAIAVADANKVIDSLDTRLLALEGNTNQTRSLEVDTKNITKETTDAESEVK